MNGGGGSHQNITTIRALERIDSKQFDDEINGCKNFLIGSIRANNSYANLKKMF